MLSRILLLAVALVSVSCGRSTDFIFHQVDEPSQSNEFTHPLKALEGNNKVDILFVVDNSASMGTHQANLKKNAAIFVNEFINGSRLDWRIGLVSTDKKDEPFIGLKSGDLLDKTRKDPVLAFQDAVSALGIRGHGIEMSFFNALQGLRNFPDFIRPGSTLAIIIISDAIEQSNLRGPEFLQELQNAQGGKGQAVVYGVLASSEFKCPAGAGEEDNIYSTSPYKEAIEGSKGRKFSLCDDFGSSLASLGADLITRTDRPFIQLKSRPFLKTIRVLHRGVELRGGPKSEGGLWFYDFDLNRIVFYSVDFAPDDTESVTITYESHLPTAK
jgi:hypothetical protein